MAFSAPTSDRLSASTSIGLAVTTSATRIRINSQRSVSHCRGLGDSDCWHGGWLEKDIRRADIKLIPCVVRAHRTVSGSNSVSPSVTSVTTPSILRGPREVILSGLSIGTTTMSPIFAGQNFFAADTSIRSCSLS